MLQQFEDNFDSLFSKYDSYKIRLKNLTNFLSKSDESVDRIFGGVFLPWNISK